MFVEKEIDGVGFVGFSILQSITKFSRSILKIKKN